MSYETGHFGHAEGDQSGRRLQDERQENQLLPVLDARTRQC